MRIGFFNEKVKESKTLEKITVITVNNKTVLCDRKSISSINYCFATFFSHHNPSTLFRLNYYVEIKKTSVFIGFSNRITKL